MTDFKGEHVTTPDGWFAMRWRTAIAVVFFLLSISNGATRFISVQAENTRMIEYNNEANQRRINHAVDKINFQHRIKDLEYELKQCKNDI